jgi:hypothetical protein
MRNTTVLGITDFQTPDAWFEYGDAGANENGVHLAMHAA